MTWLVWAIFVNFFIIGFVIGTISTRERRLPSHELLTSRVDQSWVVSVGAVPVASVATADTTHNSPPAPPRKTFTGGAPAPRVARGSQPPGDRHFFRIG